ncbi:MAG: hypothetical protein RIQ81_557 [Pseudomonadota bacterium]
MMFFSDNNNALNAVAWTVIMMGACLPPASQAHAQNVIPVRPGASNNGQASLGVVNGEEPHAVFTNPANLRVRGSLDSWNEITVMGLRTTYENDAFEPFTFSLLVPLPAAGFAVKITEYASFGAAITPTGIGTKSTIHNVPYQLSADNYATTDVHARITGFNAAIGGNLHFGETIAAGVSLVNSWDKKQVNTQIVAQETGEISEAGDVDISGFNWNTLIGLRMNTVAGTLALTALPAKVYRSSGEITSADVDQEGEITTRPMEKRDFSPFTLGAGYAISIGSWTLSAEYLRKHFSDGSDQETPYSPSDPVTVNLKDTEEFSAGVRIGISSDSWVRAGYAFRQGKLGHGEFSGGQDERGVFGMRFGELEGLDRQTVAGGYGYESGAWLFDTFTSVTWGSAMVPEDKRNSGSYTMLAGAVGMSATWSLGHEGTGNRGELTHPASPETP